MKKDDFEKQLWKIIDLIEGILCPKPPKRKKKTYPQI